ncbi:MAG: DUF5808 domain-containing protein [Ktedonobacterales bacterium]
MLSCVVLLVAVLVLLLQAQRSRTSARTPAARQVTGTVFRDDDRYWHGVFYINPDDPDLFVPKRYGLGWTINFGHPKSRLVLLALLLLVLLPLLVTGLTGGLHPYGCHPSGCSW